MDQDWRFSSFGGPTYVDAQGVMMYKVGGAVSEEPSALDLWVVGILCWNIDAITISSRY